MKSHLHFILTLFIFLCPPSLFAQKEIAPDPAHNPKNSVNWNGTYSGTLPCISCPGYKTLFQLKSNGAYTLRTQYEHKGKPYKEKSSGRIQWKINVSYFTLTKKDDLARLFVSEGYIQRLGDESVKLDSQLEEQYKLYKMIEFSNKSEALYIHTLSLKKNLETQKQDKIKSVEFTGLYEFKKNKPQGGHKSLEANYLIDCLKKTYSMPEVTYLRAPSVKA